MKTSAKISFAALLCLATACIKENTKPSSVTQQSVNNTSAATTSFHIGQSYHGGIIFYLDSTKQHGLIAATADQGVQNSWNKNGKNIITGATGTAIGTGLSNTKKIVTAQGTTGNYAALLCWKYSVDTYKNWYLPSKRELAFMYRHRDILNMFNDYWSSSEVNRGNAWEESFSVGAQFKYSKSFTLYVRAISSF